MLRMPRSDSVSRSDDSFQSSSGLGLAVPLLQPAAIATVDSRATTPVAGDQLVAARRFAEAADIEKLVVRLDDSSSAAFTHLGEMYTRAGQNQEAIASYERALKKNNANSVAKQSLEQLEDSGAPRQTQRRA
jgi:predicted Zn-dependent protease